MKADTAIYIAFEEYRVWDSSQPEKNLLRAILATALEDLKKGGGMGREARRFFMSEDDSYLFSVVSICDQLGICHRRVRAALGFSRTQFQKKQVAA